MKPKYNGRTLEIRLYVNTHHSEENALVEAQPLFPEEIMLCRVRQLPLDEGQKLWASVLQGVEDPS